MSGPGPPLLYESLGLAFLEALEVGDLDAVADLWHLAVDDEALDRLLRVLLLGDVDADGLPADPPAGPEAFPPGPPMN